MSHKDTTTSSSAGVNIQGSYKVHDYVIDQLVALSKAARAVVDVFDGLFVEIAPGTFWYQYWDADDNEIFNALQALRTQVEKIEAKNKEN